MRGNFDSLLMASFLGLTRANFFLLIFSWWDIVFSAYIFLTRTQKCNDQGFMNKNVSKSYQSYPILRYSVDLCFLELILGQQNPNNPKISKMSQLLCNLSQSHPHDAYSRCWAYGASIKGVSGCFLNKKERLTASISNNAPQKIHLLSFNMGCSIKRLETQPSLPPTRSDMLPCKNR